MRFALLDNRTKILGIRTSSFILVTPMGLIDTIKEAVKLAQKLDNIELVKMILQLQTQAMEQLQENQALRAELDQARGELKRRQSVSFDKKVNAYFSGDGQARDGPFCPKCLDVNNKLVRMLEYGNGYSGCPECKTNVRYGRVDPPPRQQDFGGYDQY